VKNQDHQQLIARSQELRGICLAVSEGLTSLASDLQKGELRQLEVTEGRISSLRQKYEFLKKDVIAFAAPYQNITNPEEITSLGALEPLLAAVNKSLKATAMNVLNQLTLVKHREQETFEPLATCLSSASKLQQAIVEVPLPDLHPEVRAIVDGTHPLAVFMTLIRDRKHMKEEKIAEIQDVIARAFGNLLFIAALMGKLEFKEQGSKGPETKEPKASEPDIPRTPESTVMTDETEEVLEQRQILQDLLTMTEMKIQKLLKNGLVREDELSEFVEQMKTMESSRYSKSDFKEDFRQLQTIRAALEELESKAFNPRKRLERVIAQRR
jgi:hypothetical protein